MVAKRVPADINHPPREEACQSAPALGKRRAQAYIRQHETEDSALALFMEGAMAKPKRIGHLVLNVKDVDTATKFYTDVLGFEIALERPGFGTFLTCGRIHHDLALFQAKEDAQEVAEGGLGLNHMAIQVEDYEELEDYYHKLQQYFEVDELRTVDHSMTKSIYIKDPDGNGIELFCNSFDTAEEGLAEMRRPGRQNTALVFS